MDVSNENIDKVSLNNLMETIEITGEECRICLKKSSSMWQVFDNQHEIARKIMACAAVQINEGDGLPTIICCDCRRLLYLSYDFKCQVEKNDSKLHQLLEFKQSLNQSVIEASISDQIIVNSDNEVKSDDNLMNDDPLNVTSDGSMIFEVSNEEFKPISSDSSPEKQVLHENELVQKLEALVDSQDDVIKEEESAMIEESELSDEDPTDAYSHDLFTERNDDEIKEENSEPKSEGLILSREKCSECSKVLESKSALQKHMNLHQNGSTLRYVCYMCDEQFSSMDKLKGHVAKAHGTLRNDKKDDSDNVSNKNDADKNLESHHLGENIRKNDKKNYKFSCKYCPKQFTYEKAYLTHAKRHSEYKNDTQVSNDSTLIGDSRSNDSEDDDLPCNGLQCTLCGKLFATKRNLKRHISTHSGLKFHCLTCNKEFSRVDKLKEHEQSKHNDFDRQFDQSDDENNTDNENKAQDNSNTKKEKPKNRPHKCQMCPKAFVQAQSLINHMERHKRVKDTQKRFLCEVCSKCFAQSGSLVAHMRTHTGVKPYVCNVCSRAFTKSTYLQLHLRTHSGEKPYICQYCSRAFARANTLARHITMHTGEAKYHCQICMKSFRRLTSLNEHTYTHTGQRPYACKICTKRYNNAGSLYAHTKKCKAQQLTHGNVAFGNVGNHQGNQGNHQSSLQTHADNDANQQNPDDSTVQMLQNYSPRKLGDESGIVSATNSFMITNVQHQKPVMANVIQSFGVDESNVYTVNNKQFKNSYYIYPSM
ncbi:zinc finger protein 568-like [Chelonus insularis]|uniref:zinc finger protein 568-like n=1 Tax=Chelonus insularis TaxID=460826 RepID=UPI00158C4006|nr:zinc finger protein 568-like [Chelonus insularis]